MLNSALLSVGLVVLAAAYLARSKLPAQVQGAVEPPAAPQAIPVVGHFIGFMRKKFAYFAELSKNSTEPIFSVSILGRKMYMVQSVPLIQAAQKQYKELSFTPIEAHFTTKMVGISEEGKKIFSGGTAAFQGDSSVPVEFHDALRDSLRPGDGYDSMNRIMARDIAEALDTLDMEAQDGLKNIALAAWLRNVVTLATTNSIYGPKNPFKDADISDAFWNFDAEAQTIMSVRFPNMAAPKGMAARERLAEGLTAYLIDGGVDDASELMKGAWNVGVVKHGMAPADLARLEIANCNATLSNTSPAAFWTLFMVYAHPGLLADVRAEVAAATHERYGAQTLEVSSLKDACPLLMSTWREMLRWRSVGTSVRKVMTDTVLAGQYLLKKDAILQMPSRLLHLDPTHFGADPESFDPRRFLKTENKGKGPNEAAFRAFGGGKTLCPGRHFATNEVLALVAMFVMRFELEPISGEWISPTTERTNLANTVMAPDWDPEVRVRRTGEESRVWVLAGRNAEGNVNYVG